MFLSIPLLQIDTAGNELLNYGPLGIGLVAVGYFAWHQYTTQAKVNEEIRKDNKESNEKYIKLAERLAALQEKQNDLMERQINQTKEFYDNMAERMKDMPVQLAERVALNSMEKQKS